MMHRSEAERCYDRYAKLSPGTSDCNADGHTSISHARASYDSPVHRSSLDWTDRLSSDCMRADLARSTTQQYDTCRVYINRIKHSPYIQESIKRLGPLRSLE